MILFLATYFILAAFDLVFISFLLIFLENLSRLEILKHLFLRFVVNLFKLIEAEIVALGHKANEFKIIQIIDLICILAAFEAILIDILNIFKKNLLLLSV